MTAIIDLAVGTLLYLLLAASTVLVVLLGLILLV